MRERHPAFERGVRQVHRLVGGVELPVVAHHLGQGVDVDGGHLGSAPVGPRAARAQAARRLIVAAPSAGGHRVRHHLMACSLSYSALSQVASGPRWNFSNALRERRAVGLDHRLLVLGGELVDQLDLGRGDLVGGLGGGLLEHRLEGLLVGVGQLAPGLAADDGQQHLGDVAGQVDVRLHFVELLGLDRRQRVLLRVDRLALQREVDLGEGDRRRVGAHDLRVHHVQRRVGHAQLQALHVGAAC